MYSLHFLLAVSCLYSRRKALGSAMMATNCIAGCKGSSLKAKGNDRNFAGEHTRGAAAGKVWNVLLPDSFKRNVKSFE